MILDEKYLLLVAESTHLIMKVEVLLKNKGISCRIIPLPGELKASCGLSIKIALEDEEILKKELETEKMEIELYSVEKKGLKKYYEKIIL